MIRYKTFYAHIDDREIHDTNIKVFVEQLCISGHTFISVKTEMYSATAQIFNRMRTEIVYQENPTRSVILEKEEKK